MFGIGPQELLIVLIVVVVLFGGRKIPEIMRGVGEGLREFRHASKQVTDDLKPLIEPESDSEGSKTTV